MTSKPTTLWSNIDFARDGKQIDWLYLPHSVTRSAYGNIAVPIAVIKNGAGPTVMFMGGNHGDEYEGPIALAWRSSKAASGASSRISACCRHRMRRPRRTRRG